MATLPERPNGGTIVERSDLKPTAPTKIALSVALAMACGLHGLPAHALRVGELQVESRLGQPLKARLPIVLSDGESLASNCVRTASRDPVGDDGVPVLNGVRTTVEKQGNTHWVTLRTSQALTEPAMRLVVEVGCENVVARRYMMLLDPPAVNEPVMLAKDEVAKPEVPRAAEGPADAQAAKGRKRKAADPAAADPAAKTAAAPQAPKPVEAAAPKALPAGKPAAATPTAAAPATPSASVSAPPSTQVADRPLTTKELASLNKREAELNKRLEQLRAELAKLDTRTGADNGVPAGAAQAAAAALPAAASAPAPMAAAPAAPAAAMPAATTIPPAAALPAAVEPNLSAQPATAQPAEPVAGGAAPQAAVADPAAQSAQAAAAPQEQAPQAAPAPAAPAVAEAPKPAPAPKDEGLLGMVSEWIPGGLDEGLLDYLPYGAAALLGIGGLGAALWWRRRKAAELMLDDLGDEEGPFTEIAPQAVLPKRRKPLFGKAPAPAVADEEEGPPTTLFATANGEQAEIEVQELSEDDVMAAFNDLGASGKKEPSVPVVKRSVVSSKSFDDGLPTQSSMPNVPVIKGKPAPIQQSYQAPAAPEPVAESMDIADDAPMEFELAWQPTVIPQAAIDEAKEAEAAFKPAAKAAPKAEPKAAPAPAKQEPSFDLGDVETLTFELDKTAELLDSPVTESLTLSLDTMGELPELGNEPAFKSDDPLLAPLAEGESETLGIELTGLDFDLGSVGLSGSNSEPAPKAAAAPAATDAAPSLDLLSFDELQTPAPTSQAAVAALPAMTGKDWPAIHKLYSSTSDVVEEAAGLALGGDFDGAIAKLQKFVREQSQAPAAPWVMLFRLFRAVDARPMFEALAQRFRRRFGRTVPGWEHVAWVAQDDGLDARPAVRERVWAHWGTPAALSAIAAVFEDAALPEVDYFSAALHADLLKLAKLCPAPTHQPSSEDRETLDINLEAIA